MTTINNEPQNTTAKLEVLTLPKRPHQELAIVGGGVAGLLVAKAAAERVALLTPSSQNRLAPRPVRIPGPIRSVSILLGGDSLAYSPVRGDFSELLTVTGTDTTPRVRALDELRTSVANVFRDLSLNFEQGTRATQISLSSNGRFRVDTFGTGKPSYFESDKLVLALGHTLREVPPTLTPYVIRGGGELCARLTEFLPQADSRGACLERLLSLYRPVDGDILRIGLVGLGASMFEVIKVFDTLLMKPDHRSDKYTVPGSRMPVEFVIYDSHLATHKDTYQALLALLAQRLATTHETNFSTEVRQSNRNIAERFIKLWSAGQIKLIPHRVDWNQVGLHEGLVTTNTASDSSPELLSLLIDCAPFEEGIGHEQRATIERLPMVDLKQIKPGLWQINAVAPEWKNRLAFAGAAILPRWQWNAEQLQNQAKTIIDTFYGIHP